MTTTIDLIEKQIAANDELIAAMKVEVQLIRIKLQHLEDKVNHAKEN
jgi:hypothetical protein